MTLWECFLDLTALFGPGSLFVALVVPGPEVSGDAEVLQLASASIPLAAASVWLECRVWKTLILSVCSSPEAVVVQEPIHASPCFAIVGDVICRLA